MIYRKLLLLTALMIAATTPKAGAQQPTPHYEIAGRDTTCRIFLYSPEPTKGVHAAYLTGKGTWQDMGQLCASDYGPWGKGEEDVRPLRPPCPGRHVATAVRSQQLRTLFRGSLQRRLGDMAAAGFPEDEGAWGTVTTSYPEGCGEYRHLLQDK